jgi:hypothetical protein
MRLAVDLCRAECDPDRTHDLRTASRKAALAFSKRCQRGDMESVMGGVAGSEMTRAGFQQPNATPSQ